MDYVDFIHYGNKVRWTYKQYNFYRAICIGYGSIPYEEKTEIVTVIGSPRNADNYRFISLNEWFDDEEVEIKVRNEKGNEFYVTLYELSVYQTIADLSFDDLKTLREEISLGSLFLDDYENSFGVDTNEVCNYADGFGQEIDWNDELDTPENFALYCRGDFCVEVA
jgi:hypothetical protein